MKIHNTYISVDDRPTVKMLVQNS